MVRKLNNCKNRKIVESDESYMEDELQIPTERIFGYHFCSLMTYDDFFIISKDYNLCKKYGDELVRLLRTPMDEDDELMSDFIDNLPKGVYITDIEYDYCEYYGMGRWVIELDNGNRYSVDLVGEYKSRF